MKGIKKKDYFYTLLILILILLSFLFGYKYSLYNQDFHHWGYITAQFFEFQNNQRLYKDIFLQYGAGQIFFFTLINFFYKIDIVTIGLIFNLIYALNFLIIYKIFRFITSKRTSTIITIVIFLLHPFSLLPWSDYLSGFFLNLFIYFFLKLNSEKKIPIILAILLFASTFFRQSYIISIVLAVLFFLLLNLIFTRKIIFKKIFISLFFFILIFLITLFYFENLEFHIMQFTKSVENFANTTNALNVKEKILDKYGYNLWILFRLIYFFLRFFINLFNIYSIDNIIFITSITIVLILFYNFSKKIYLPDIFLKKIIFISLIGLTGLIQSLYNFETFRIINSSMGIFVGALYYTNLKMIDCNNTKAKKNLNFFFLTFFITTLAFSFYNNLIKKKFLGIDNDSYYSFEDNVFFGKKKIKKDSFTYYSKIAEIICKADSFTINNSHDFAISYLCKDKKNPIPFYLNSKLLSQDNKPNQLKVDSKEVFIITHDQLIDQTDYILNKKILINHENWNGPKTLYIYKRVIQKRIY
jgi:hypothetical protein